MALETHIHHRVNVAMLALMSFWHRALTSLCAWVSHDAFICMNMTLMIMSYIMFELITQVPMEDVRDLIHPCEPID